MLTREEARAVLASPDESLLDMLAGAYRVRRHYWGNRVRLHFLCNAQSGLCPEDCHYCSQSSVSESEIDKYPMLAREKILEAAGRAATLKAALFAGSLTVGLWVGHSRRRIFLARGARL